MVILPLVTAACGDDSGASSSDAAPVDVNTVAPPARNTAPTIAPSADSNINDTSSGRLSANHASIAELSAAFEAAGISNARRWAREVDEYRPYDITDTGYSKLRGELAKYNPAPGRGGAIIAELELP